MHDSLIKATLHLVLWSLFGRKHLEEALAYKVQMSEGNVMKLNGYEVV